MSEDEVSTNNEAQPAAETPEDLERLREEAAAAKEQSLRYAAEAENTRRRAEREVNDARAYAITKFARDLFGVADNLARALSHAPKDDSDPLARNLAIGLELTQKDLIGAFERNGLAAIAPKPGDRFDPHLHQAMSEQPSATIAAGGVVEALQSGYQLYGRVLRPALVVVAARGSGGAPGDGQPVAAEESAAEG